MIQIFLESKHDKTVEADFIQKFLRHITGNDEWKKQVKIIPLNGKDNLKNSVNTFQDNSDAGGTNLVIFDADEVINSGGFDKRKKELLKQKSDLSIEFELFLFPNNAEDGDFETLISLLINQKHNELLECFTDYELCVGGKKDENGISVYKTPARKSKMYTYIDSMKKSRKENNAFKHENHDYFFENKEYWNLDADYGKPLREFLLSFL